jgi:HK97 family phage major capsid protein
MSYATLKARTLRLPAILALAAAAGGVFPIMNDGADSDDVSTLNDSTINNYLERQANLSADSSAILAKLDEEKREPTTEEAASVKENTAEINRLQGLINMRADALRLNASLAAPKPRATTPTATPAQENNGGARPAFSAGRTTPSNLQGQHARTQGFGHMGEFSRAVLNAELGRGDLDVRLRNASVSTSGNEGSGADGGFLVPPEFRDRILAHVFDETDLLGRTDQQITSRNSISFPVDENTPWGTSGVRGYWVGEGTAPTQSKHNFRERTLKTNKLAALCPVTDELLEDAPSLGNYMESAVGRVFSYIIGNSIIDGSGAGQPLGFLRSPALVTVAAEGGQTADTVNAANVTNMWARMPATNRMSAIWLVNPDVEAQLIRMTLGGSSVAFPVYMPPNGLSQSPFATLLGRPVVPHMACKAIGDVGDICYVDLKQYVTAVKTGGIKTDVSMHLFFDQAVSAYRFVLRIDGRPWPSQAITPPNGSSTLSPFLTLAAR